MEKTKQPTKEQVRSYIETRQAERKMPPSLEEIRRQLGWHLCGSSGDKENLIMP
jgi:hypothetical protein